MPEWLSELLATHGPWALGCVVLSYVIRRLWLALQEERADKLVLSKAFAEKVEELQEKRIVDHREVQDAANAAILQLSAEMRGMAQAMGPRGGGQ